MSGDPYEAAWAVNGHRGGGGVRHRCGTPPNTGLDASLAAVTASQIRCNSGASHTQISISSSSLGPSNSFRSSRVGKGSAHTRVPFWAR